MKVPFTLNDCSLLHCNTDSVDVCEVSITNSPGNEHIFKVPVLFCLLAFFNGAWRLLVFSHGGVWQVKSTQRIVYSEEAANVLC